MLISQRIPVRRNDNPEASSASKTSKVSEMKWMMWMRCVYGGRINDDRKINLNSRRSIAGCWYANVRSGVFNICWVSFQEDGNVWDFDAVLGFDMDL